MVTKYGKGKHPNSRCRSPFKFNENCFAGYSMSSCYWAGFIAADGNIYGNQLTISLQLRDKGHLDVFRDFIETNQHLNYRKDGSPVLKISNTKVCNDVMTYFNITPKKSLTLQPPRIDDTNLIDAYILGYTDGDGSIMKTHTGGKDYLRINILGTSEVLSFIKTRFDTILETESAKIHKYGNIYSIIVSGKKAVKLFKHYHNINIYKLKRKWDYEKYKHILNAS